MIQKFCLIMCLFSLSISPVFALDEKEVQGIFAEFKQKIKPLVRQYLGNDVASMLFGSESTSISLPPIPKVKEDAKSTEIYNKKPSNKKPLPKDELQKYNIAFINEVFQSTRNMSANRNDVSIWINAMNQGADREGVYRALVLDGTYAGLENYEKPINPAVVDFALSYFVKYVGKEVKKKSLDGINIFSLKRIAVEDTLEVMDELAKNEEQLYDWYAVLSGELAEKYPGVWNEGIRKDTSAVRHREWAKTVPDQFIKSEVIIKLHKVFNHLMN